MRVVQVINRILLRCLMHTVNVQIYDLTQILTLIIIQKIIWMGNCVWRRKSVIHRWHYNDVILGAIASQITSHTIVYGIVYSEADQRKHQSSPSLAFVPGIHRGPVNSPHNWPFARKMFPFDDTLMDIPQMTWYYRNDIIASRARDHLNIRTKLPPPPPLGW